MKPAIGLFGGSFDPVHHGHLRSAIDVCQHLNLQQVTFIPAFVSPHKTNNVENSAQSALEMSGNHQHVYHRFTMLEMATKDCKQFSVSDYEIKQPKTSFTVDTIKHFRLKNPDTPLVFLMGMDSFVNFTTWHCWQDILASCHLVVSHRPGYCLTKGSNASQLLAKHQTTSLQALHSTLGGLIYLHEDHPLSISSSNIRALVSQGQPITYLTPPNVEHYIKQHQLYLS